jgi:hypothetical protein
MFAYVAYGLRIQSALPLPELVADEAAATGGEADAVIRFGKVKAVPFETNGVARRIHAIAGEVYLFWQGIGLFLVRGGCEIIIDPAPGVEERVLRLFILGTTLAMLLHQRGQVVVLHASTAAISGQAVAFAGAGGMGKSIIAATLHQRGHGLLGDDILAVDVRNGYPVALPGFPYLKLWPDAVASLGCIPEALPRLRPELEKRGYRITTGFSPAPLPLKCIYVLNRGPEPKIEPLCPPEALIELMPHWYGARFGTELLQALGLAAHFLQCTTLVNKTTVCRLERPDSLSSLPDVVRLVEGHLASDSQVAARPTDYEQKQLVARLQT